MRRAILVSLVVVAVAAVAWALWFLRPDPTGMAVGRIDPAERRLHAELWQAMAPSGGVFLSAFDDVLREPPNDPVLLATAFNELAYQVTGRSGIWRKTLPNDVFGCPQNPELPVCGRLKDLDAQFSQWDELQSRLASVEDERQARQILRESAPMIREYLRTLVPATKSFSAIQATPFFSQHLAPAMQQAPSRME